MKSSKASTGPIVPLAWSRMLGFDQAPRSGAENGPILRVRLARVGVKVGAKPGLKPKPGPA